MLFSYKRKSYELVISVCWDVMPCSSMATFWRNLPSDSLFFYLEDLGSRFLQNINMYVPNFMV
jgi:hypothetical protein